MLSSKSHWFDIKYLSNRWSSLKMTDKIATNLVTLHMLNCKAHLIYSDFIFTHLKKTVSGIKILDCIWTSLWWHNEGGGVLNHQPHDCLLNRLFRRRSKKTSKLLVTGLCAGDSPVTGETPHKEPVTQKMFSFNDVTTEEAWVVATHYLIAWLSVANSR